MADNKPIKSNIQPAQNNLSQRPSLLGRINMRKAALAQQRGKPPQKERNKEI
ncbi:MAG: hypothetical protein ACI4EA_06445 [Candidatus Ornithomonoglobus sp.]